jgi:hypothetical protein
VLDPVALLVEFLALCRVALPARNQVLLPVSSPALLRVVRLARHPVVLQAVNQVHLRVGHRLVLQARLQALPRRGHLLAYQVVSQVPLLQLLPAWHHRPLPPHALVALHLPSPLVPQVRLPVTRLRLLPVMHRRRPLPLFHLWLRQALLPLLHRVLHRVLLRVLQALRLVRLLVLRQAPLLLSTVFRLAKLAVQGE